MARAGMDGIMNGRRLSGSRGVERKREIGWLGIKR